MVWRYRHHMSSSPHNIRGGPWTVVPEGIRESPGRKAGWLIQIRGGERCADQNRRYCMYAHVVRSRALAKRARGRNTNKDQKSERSSLWVVVPQCTQSTTLTSRERR